MRMSYLKPCTLLLGCLVFITSCQKTGINPPEINFLSPMHFETISLNSAMVVDIDIKDDIEIDYYQLSLTSESGFELFNEKKFVKESSHHISYKFALTAEINQIFNISLVVKDNEGNKSKGSIEVTVDK